MKNWLITATIFYVIALLPSLMLTGMAPTLIQAAGSVNSTALWLALNCLQMLPVLLIVSIAGMWIWHRKSAKKIALAFSLLPVADVAFLGIAYFVLAFTG